MTRLRHLRKPHSVAKLKRLISLVRFRLIPQRFPIDFEEGQERWLEKSHILQQGQCRSGEDKKPILTSQVNLEKDTRLCKSSWNPIPSWTCDCLKSFTLTIPWKGYGKAWWRQKSLLESLTISRLEKHHTELSFRNCLISLVWDSDLNEQPRWEDGQKRKEGHLCCIVAMPIRRGSNMPIVGGLWKILEWNVSPKLRNWKVTDLLWTSWWVQKDRDRENWEGWKTFWHGQPFKGPISKNSIWFIGWVSFI